MTSIERLVGTAPPLPEIAAVCARHFGQIFQRELVAAESAVRESAAVGAP